MDLLDEDLPRDPRIEDIIEHIVDHHLMMGKVDDRGEIRGTEIEFSELILQHPVGRVRFFRRERESRILQIVDTIDILCAGRKENGPGEWFEIAVQRFQDRNDAVFLPGPFLPRPVVATAVERARLALRQGGWLLFGLYAPIDDPLSASLTDLRTVRSGGHPWAADEVVALMDAAGLTATRAFERDWQMPMTFVAGMRPN